MRLRWLLLLLHLAALITLPDRRRAAPVGNNLDAKIDTLVANERTRRGAVPDQDFDLAAFLTTE